MTEAQPWFVYIVECSDSSLYTGTTNNLQKRIGLHNTGKGAKYTHFRAPVKLIYNETFPDRSTACIRESEIKKLTREQKKALVTSKSSTSASV